MRITTLVVPVLFSMVGAGVLQAQQGASPAAGGNPATPSPRAGGPAGPLANVSKALPRRKDVLVDQKEQLIAASRASVRRARGAQQQPR